MKSAVNGWGGRQPGRVPKLVDAPALCYTLLLSL
jgi:hypothetical protein